MRDGRIILGQITAMHRGFGCVTQPDDAARLTWVVDADAPDRRPAFKLLCRLKEYEGAGAYGWAPRRVSTDLSPEECISTTLEPPKAFELAISFLPIAPHPEITNVRMANEANDNGRVTATQAVDRAIDILLAVADGPLTLPELVERTGLPKTTCYRLAKTLADRGMLSTSGRSGYRLGTLLRHLAEK